MAEIDSDLVSVLRQAKSKPMHFAFVAKGPSEGKLLAAKMPVPAKKVNQAKADLGGGLVFKGRCFGEDGQLVFEVPKEPPGTLATQLKKIITRDTGLMFRVEVRVNQSLEEAAAPPAAAPEAPVPPPPRPAGANQADVVKRLKALMGDLQTALGRKGPEAPRLQSTWAAVKSSVDQRDFEQASRRLDELESLLGKIKPAPDGVPPPPPSPSGKAAVLKRLAALLGPYKAAVAAKGPTVPRLQALFASLKTLLDKQNFPQANQVLDELEPLLARTGAASNGAVPPPPGDPRKAALLKRLNALAGGIKAALAGPNAARVQALLVAVNGLIKKGDFEPAGKSLDELEALVGPPPAAAQAPGPPPGSKVAFAQAKIRWNEAKDRVRRQLDDLQNKVREEFNDPNTTAALENLNKILEGFNAGLGDTLDELYNAGEDQQAPLRVKVGQIVDKYLAYVQKDPLVVHAKNNPFLPVPLQETLEQPLQDLRTQLAAAGR